MEIVKGRPLNVKERLKKEVRVYDLLDELDIEYWRIDHEVAQTMEDCEEVDRILDAVICKNLFLCNRQKTKFYLLMMPEIRRLRQKNCLHRSRVHACLLLRRNIWRNFWILLLVLSV